MTGGDDARVAAPGNEAAVLQAQLAPAGVLKAAINLSNSLLVSGKDAQGQWTGVAPSLAAAIAQELRVPLQLVPYATPAEVANDAASGAWSIAMIGADPARARHIAFTEPYAEIEAAYLVPAGSPLRHADEVDQAGHRVAAYQGSAFGIWLERHLRHATLVHGDGFDGAIARFRDESLDALASLMPKLLQDRQAIAGSRILEGCFMTVQQAVGVARRHEEAAAFLQRFVRGAKSGGLVAALIEQFRPEGLQAAPLAP